MLDSAETGPVAGFDALIGFSLPGSATSLATPGLLQRCCAVLADGAPILLGEPVEDAFLGFLLQAAAPAMESMVHASADGSHEAIIQQFDAARAVERTVDLSDDGALRLICGRAGARHSDGALSGGNVAVIAPRDCGELVAGYGLPSGKQFDQDDFAACEAWVGTLESDASVP